MCPLISVKAPIKRAAMLLTCGNKSGDVNEGTLAPLRRSLSLVRKCMSNV